MRHRRNYLFADGDLSATLRENLERVSPAIDRISRDQLLATPNADLVDHFVHELGVEPLSLLEEHMGTTEGETQVDVSGDPNRFFGDERTGPFYVPGHRIEISIPYTGDAMLWKLKPSSWKSVFPCGDALPQRGSQLGSLHLKFSTPVDSLNEERLGDIIKRELELIRFYVESAASEVRRHNDELRESIKRAISARRERIQKTEGIASRLGLPVKRNPNAPDVEAIKVARKLVRPLPPLKSGSYKPEYGIEDQTYEHILAVIRHEIATFEATPSTYKSLGEEDLRNILLAHLNGHYEGDATGETFRKGGKTDIRIETESRAAFIAECKLWSGTKGLCSAVDQLLGYLTWRDCKTALIIFNKEVKSFSSVIEKCPVELQTNAKYKRVLATENRTGEWRFCFQSANDELREVTIHVFVADLFVAHDA